MSLELRNKKVSETYEKYKIAQWGNGNTRMVRTLRKLFVMHLVVFTFYINMYIMKMLFRLLNIGLFLLQIHLENFLQLRQPLNMYTLV